jgi:hypothetical protein
MTDLFARKYGRCEPIEQRWIDAVKRQLEQNLQVGKPLRSDWFREKKLGGKRLFYIINTVTCKALLVDFGTKKEQPRIIRDILARKEELLGMIAGSTEPLDSSFDGVAQAHREAEQPGVRNLFFLLQPLILCQRYTDLPCFRSHSLVFHA